MTNFVLIGSLEAASVRASLAICSSKPIGTRQGNGKGAPEGWVAVVKQGAVMFEMADVDEQIAREALTLAASKLPIKTKFVAKREVEE